MGVLDEDIQETGWSDVEPYMNYSAFKERLRGLIVEYEMKNSRFYRTYTFYKAQEQRSAQYIRFLPQYLSSKQRALDQYKRWVPENGEFAWGYHSVQYLIDASYTDPHLYIDMLDNDPVNPHKWIAASQGGSGDGTLESVPGRYEHTANGTRLLVGADEGSAEGASGSGGHVASGSDVDDDDDKGWTEAENANRKQFIKSVEDAIKKPEGRG
ncbi:hypothetical protein BGZ54_005184, partial [Gamsiella multidivaricata]